jgi:hypothetical protein
MSRMTTFGGVFGASGRHPARKLPSAANGKGFQRRIKLESDREPA